MAAVPQSWEQQLYALCRWLEPDVVASHRAAARLLGLGDIKTDLLEVTVPVKRERPPGVIIHTSDVMPPCDRRIRRLIPATDATRTAIDCCAVLSEKSAQAVIDDACHHRMTTPDRLIQRIDGLAARGRNGVGLARELVEARIRNLEMPESRLTRMVLRLIQESPLPNPVSLHPVELPSGVTIHPDLAYPWLLIAIEADGWGEHGRPEGWQRDRHRDNPLQNLGWIVLRFTWEDVTMRQEYVLRTVADALRRRGLAI